MGLKLGALVVKSARPPWWVVALRADAPDVVSPRDLGLLGEPRECEHQFEPCPSHGIECGWDWCPECGEMTPSPDAL